MAEGLLDEKRPLAGFLDADGIRDSVDSLRAAFATRPGVRVLHTFAAKAGSLIPVLRLLADCGMGCQVAGPGELRLAVEAGFSPAHIVLDSPAKTRDELRLALALGVAVAADGLGEIRRIEELRSPGSPSVLGLRVNPQVGGGSIGATSTATAASRFGVALRDPGARERVVRAFAERPWLTRLHTHVGSQGGSLDLIAAGIAETYRLAEEINSSVGTHRVAGIGIGGGLPDDFADDEARPDFAEYATALRAAAPGIFDGRYDLVTEFGSSLLAGNGFIGARVEYTKDAGGRRIALTHAGAPIATGTVFMPAASPLRVGAFDEAGRPRGGPPMVQDIAGPCSFTGDIVAHARKLPELREGDFVTLQDTRAYHFSTPWAHNSLPRPAVYGFAGEAGGLRFAQVREAQSLDSVAAESGLRQADALTGLHGRH
ncbi:type III PLP-dependent enzyme domain-containing protein [Streptomyces pratensis]|uniref:diaminopimelate decarboxylase n=1 Tax=Streptomyces pratensis TaxID=1169025 RepID=UPI00363AFD8F